MKFAASKSRLQSSCKGRSFFRALVALAVLIFLTVPARAHLGSQSVFFEGPAGPYPVRVTIFPPGVVPGLAQIHVRVHSGQPQTVTVLPVRSDAGTKGAPPPDVARAVPGETNLFTAQLWFMRSGAYSVFVDVTGPEGHGTAIVPMNALAMQRLGMSPGMRLLFAAFGVFLVVLLVSVVGAATRESTLESGFEPSPRRRRLSVVMMGVAVLVIAGAARFGDKWWNLVDRDYLSSTLYRPMPITPELKAGAKGGGQLTLRVDTNSRYGGSQLVPDHGHIMHLFLVRQQGDAFAHLHPARGRDGDGAFLTRLPGLPAGTYQLYADVTHESGLTETLTNVVELASATPDPEGMMNEDDAFDLRAAKTGPVQLEGGFTLTPELGAKIRANEEVTLKFEAADAHGQPAPLEPYLGMYGHLMVQSEDGGVFAHLHPLGTISMEAQRRFAEREHAGYLASQPLDLLCAPPSRELAFPYAFPRPGHYRLWLQVKLNGKVRTTPFSVTVD